MTEVSPAASSEATRLSMRANRSRDTKPERVIRSALHRMGLRFTKHARPLEGLRCEADVVFRRQRVAVFVDGCWWHGCAEHWTAPKLNTDFWSRKIERNRARDQANRALLKSRGWTVIGVWEHEDLGEAAARIADAVGRCGSS